jgi:hypothetical protein
VIELQKLEKSKFSLIEKEEFILAKSLAKYSQYANRENNVHVPESMTLAMELKRSYPTESELEQVLKKPTVKQVYKYSVFTLL